MRNPQPAEKLRKDTEHLPRERWAGPRVTEVAQRGLSTKLLPSLCQSKCHLLLTMGALREPCQAPLATASNVSKHLSYQSQGTKSVFPPGHCTSNAHGDQLVGFWHTDPLP